MIVLSLAAMGKTTGVGNMSIKFDLGQMALVTQLKLAVKVAQKWRQAMLPEDIDRWTAVLRQRREVLAGRDSAEVAAIDAALERLRTGTFGQCQRCGAAISEGRMHAQPSAATCLACQELAERQRPLISIPVA